MNDVFPPSPQPDSGSEPFYEALNEDRIVIQRCADCGATQLARQRCRICRSRALHWEDASGRGRVHSFTRIHLVYHPAFAERIPYVAGLVELEEGPRFYVPMEGGEPIVGATGTIEIRARGDGQAVPVFRLDDAQEE